MRIRARDIPNIISFLRILLTIPVVDLLLDQQFGNALIVFAIAGFSDGLDGFLAKHFGWQSRLGGLLDPLADKALLLASFLVLGSMGLIPVWLVSLVILRDLIIMGGALLYHFEVEDLEAQPSLISKVNTLFQILTVLMVVASAGPWPMPDGVIESLVGITAFTTIASGVNYVWVWWHRAVQKGWHQDD